MPDIFQILSRWKKEVVFLTITSLILAAAIVFILPSKYLAVTTAVPASAVNNDRANVFNNNIQQLQTSSSSTPITYATILNSNNSSGLGTATNNNVLTTSTTSIINGGRQQQYHRPLLRGMEETSNTGILNSYDGKENQRRLLTFY